VTVSGRLQKYKRLFDDVRRGRLARVYFLYGTEEHMKREFVRALIEAALPEGDRTFNLDIVHGDEFDATAFSERLQSFPLFASRRLVILRDFETLSPSDRDGVAEQAASVPETLILVIESSREKLDTAAHKRAAAAAGSHGVSFAFEALDEGETLERILARFRREAVEVDPEALDLLIESVGTRLIDLANEVDKILLAAPDGGRITRDIVAEVVGRYRTESLFAFLDGVGVADPGTTVTRLGGLVDAGEEPVFVVAMLLRRVVSLLEVQQMVDERGRAVATDRALADAIAATPSPFFAGRLRTQAARVPRAALETLLVNLRWADLKLKTTSLDARSVIEEALLASHVGKGLATPAPAS
jgi:DNA polymerase-3 subunit delta